MASNPREWPFMDRELIKGIFRKAPDVVFRETRETLKEIHPLVSQLVPRLEAASYPIVPKDVPWIQLKWQWVLGDWALGGAIGEDFIEILQSQDQDHHLLAAQLSLALHQAVPFLWLEDLRKVAMDSSIALPRFTITEDLFPFAAMWFVWERNLIIPDDPEFGHAGWLLFLTAGGPAFAIMGQDHITGQHRISQFGLLGEYGDIIQGHRNEAFFKLLAFAQSPFLTVKRERGDRPARRQWKKATGHEMPEVAMVVLRSVQVIGKGKEEEGEGLDWNYRWLVRGHFRNQWYPSIKAHRLIWIAPYVKGPEDKPLKPPGYLVAR